MPNEVSTQVRLPDRPLDRPPAGRPRGPGLASSLQDDGIADAAKIIVVGRFPSRKTRAGASPSRSSTSTPGSSTGSGTPSTPTCAPPRSTPSARKKNARGGSSELAWWRRRRGQGRGPAAGCHVDIPYGGGDAAGCHVGRRPVRDDVRGNGLAAAVIRPRRRTRKRHSAMWNRREKTSMWRWRLSTTGFATVARRCGRSTRSATRTSRRAASATTSSRRGSSTAGPAPTSSCPRRSGPSARSRPCFIDPRGAAAASKVSRETTAAALGGGATRARSRVAATPRPRRGDVVATGVAATPRPRRGDSVERTPAGTAGSASSTPRATARRRRSRSRAASTARTG